MSQILLPPPPPSSAEPAANASALVVAPARQRMYEPDPPKKPSAFWRIVKWPLRQLFKALYLTGSAAKRHRVVTAIVLVILLLLGGGSYAVYQVTHPQAAANPGRTALGPLSGGGNTPFTISSNAQPPLAPQVINFLHAWKTYDAQELASTLSPKATLDGPLFSIPPGATLTQADWQARFDQLKSRNIVFQQFIYSGGYLSPAGTANYTVQVVVAQQGSQGVFLLTWYFLVGPDGQISAWHDLTSLG
jgi:hypothetical protein